MALAELISVIAQGVVLCDDKGVVVGANEAARSMLGEPKLYGRNAVDVLAAFESEHDGVATLGQVFGSKDSLVCAHTIRLSQVQGAFLGARHVTCAIVPAKVGNVRYALVLTDRTDQVVAQFQRLGVQQEDDFEDAEFLECATVRGGPDLELKDPSNATIVVENGPLLGRTFQVSRSMEIGRQRECEIQLPDTGVSRRHCKIVWSGGKHTIEDLGSTNGTRVNGQDVQHKVLRDGDVIQLGPRIRLRFAIAEVEE